MIPKVSLIISFYRKVKELQLVLASLKRQSFNDFEVVIADDGSDDGITGALNQLIEGNSAFPVKHIWHPRNGWQKNTILNKAIVASESEYLVFIDGDCILHPRFIEEHYEHRIAGGILGGRRVYLSQRVTDKISVNTINSRFFPWNLFLRAAVDSLLPNGTGHIENGFYLQHSLSRKLFNKKPRVIKGSNFSLHKVDFLLLNGFDERYNGPGIGEDDDVYYRGKNLGFQFATLKFIAVQYHMYHKTLDRPNTNGLILEETLRNNTGYTPFGIVR